MVSRSDCRTKGLFDGLTETVLALRGEKYMQRFGTEDVILNVIQKIDGESA